MAQRSNAKRWEIFICLLIGFSTLQYFLTNVVSRSNEEVQVVEQDTYAPQHLDQLDGRRAKGQWKDLQNLVGVASAIVNKDTHAPQHIDKLGGRTAKGQWKDLQNLVGVASAIANKDTHAPQHIDKLGGRTAKGQWKDLQNLVGVASAIANKDTHAPQHIDKLGGRTAKGQWKDLQNLVGVASAIANKDTHAPQHIDKLGGRTAKGQWKDRQNLVGVASAIANKDTHAPQHIDKLGGRTAKGQWTDPQNMVRVASAIAKKHGVVLFSVLNDAFASLAASWLCNTEPLGNVHPKVLFLTTDAATGRTLQRRWPEINVVFANASAFAGGQFYSTASYVRLMVERTRYIQRLVQARIRLLLFEVDFVWLTDPLPAILSYDADVVGIPVLGTNRTKTCGCFLMLNPKPTTIKLWNRLTEMMDALDKRIAGKGDKAFVSQKANDQMFLSKLLTERYGGVKVAHLPEPLFRDGRWYGRWRIWVSSKRPMVIHNNYVIGVKKKITRAKRFKHWFLTSNSTSSDFSCNATAAREFVSRT